LRNCRRRERLKTTPPGSGRVAVMRD
jgi:hypothetical protein